MKRPSVAELELRIAEGKRLRAWREVRGVIRRELAADLDVSPYVVQSWESGVVRIPLDRREQLRELGC